MKHRFKRHRQAFTLIELLVTMAIILVLVGMLIPAVNAVKEKSKKTMAFAEMKNIESAWRDYLTVYRKPPISMSIPGLIPRFESPGAPIIGSIAGLLKGQNIDGLNSKEQAFMDFKRLDSDGDPITPWGSAEASKNNLQYWYHVKFDKNFDHYVNKGIGEPLDPPTASIGRDFIVWAYNPNVDDHVEGHVLRSWEQ